MAAGEEFGILPCGLGARDTLRTEMGYPLHGQDISLDVTPNEARLGWAVGWTKDAFWGKDALLAEKEAGPAPPAGRRSSTGRAIPRPHMSVSLTPDVLLGEVTSGTFSPTLKEGIGLALVAVRGRSRRRRSASTSAAAARSSSSPSRRSSTRRCERGLVDEPARAARHLPQARPRPSAPGGGGWRTPTAPRSR